LKVKCGHDISEAPATPWLLFIPLACVIGAAALGSVLATFVASLLADFPRLASVAAFSIAAVWGIAGLVSYWRLAHLWEYWTRGYEGRPFDGRCSGKALNSGITSGL